MSLSLWDIEFTCAFFLIEYAFSPAKNVVSLIHVGHVGSEGLLFALIPTLKINSKNIKKI
jgi:hypothetical protein